MGDFNNQFYSNIIVYDERKKYLYTWARKNKPHLDDEIRNESLANVDQIRRAVQHTFGNVGASESTYSNTNVGATNAFKVMASPTDQTRNFLIRGGSEVVSTEGNTEHPAVLFARGYYIILRGNLEYNMQNNLGNYLASNYTETAIPSLTDPAPGQERVDLVYVDLHFAEASSLDVSEYTDDNLKNPIVGETQNRARAVVDIRVWEDFRNLKVDGSARPVDEIQTLRIDENIFDSKDFLGSLDTELLSDPNPANHHYRIPIAVIYRRGTADITDNDILDLLELYDKRFLTQEEITHRLAHGGYTQRDVTDLNLNSSEAGYSGLFTPRYSSAKVDEGAYATGANEGIGSEALNTNAVTPRTLDTYGKFAMDSLLVGGETGVPTGPLDGVTGPVDLRPGEGVINNLSVKSLYVGYDRGVSGNREYTDRENIHMQGITGAAGLAIINDTGETGAISMRITGSDYYTHVDYKGRHGLGTNEPGWSGPDEVWNSARFSGTSDVAEIIHDNAESAQVQKHLYVGKDSHVKRDSFGPTWKIPGVIDRDNPVLIGVTGVPQYGITGSPASMQVVPGVAAVGVTGSLKGYTGNFGFYESYDSDGSRVFTIGSRGIDFDRQTLSLYGTDLRDCFLSDADFLNLPGSLSALAVGDDVSYDIELTSGQHVTGSVTTTIGGYSGLLEVANDINYQAGFCETGISYTYYKAKEAGDTGAPTTVTITDGVRKGAQINFEGEGDDNTLLKLVVKSMPEINLPVDDVSASVDRFGFPVQAIDFIQAAYFGSGEYGGDVVDLRFLKMDLGEAADAWLFNGDVFFNGDGLLNRVTFSPNVVFRDDVFIYGKLSAQELLLTSASMNSLNVGQNVGAGNYLSVTSGFALGYGDLPDAGFNALATMFSNAGLTDFNLVGTVDGGVRVHNVMFSGGSQSNYKDSGAIWALNTTSSAVNVGAIINGTYNDTDWPFGIHLFDTRGVSASSLFSTFVMDAHTYAGDPPTLRNFEFWVKGDFRLGVIEDGSLLGGSALIRRLTLGLSATEVDTSYVLSLASGNAYIQNLVVGSLSYADDANTGDATFYEPQNITTVQPVLGEQSYPKTDGIIRVKEFSLDTFTKPPAILRNNGKLSDTGFADFAAKNGYWGHDTLTFARDIVETFSASRGDDTITSDQDFNARDITETLDGRSVEKWEYYRNNFSRIILMKLGTVKMVFKGYSVTDTQGGSGAGGDIPISYLSVSTYEFTSSLFKSNEEGSQVFNWSSGSPGNVHMINVGGSFNDSEYGDLNAGSNLLYNISGSLGLYYIKNMWNAYEEQVTRDGLVFYQRYVYYPYTNVVVGYHNFDVDPQTDLSAWPNYVDRPTGTWKVGLFPKVRQQKIYGQAGQGFSTNSDERWFEVQWDLNVVLYPTDWGGVNNLAGEIKMSYM